MTISTIIPVPHTVQTLAWQQAYALITDHIDALDPVQIAIAADIARRKVPTLDWEQCRDAARLYGRVVGDAA